MYRETIEITALKRGLHNVTEEVAAVLDRSSMTEGLLNVFITHTSASIVMNENADPQVCGDLEAYFDRLVPDGDPLYLHTAEGPDDMSAHVKHALTQTSITIPFEIGKLLLGRWQGLFLWEHREIPRVRKLIITVTE